MNKTSYAIKAILSLLVLALVTGIVSADFQDFRDFEEPSVNNDYNWDIFDNSSIDGWFVQWVDSSCTNKGPFLEIQEHSLNGWSAANGSQWAELDTDCGGPGNGLETGEACNVKLSQTVRSQSGQNCWLNFSYSPRPDHSKKDSLVVYINDSNGNLITNSYTASGQLQWTRENISFMPDGAATVSFMENGDADTYGMFLDDVKITCGGEPTPPVPELHTCVLVGIGLVGLVVLLRRE